MPTNFILNSLSKLRLTRRFARPLIGIQIGASSLQVVVLQRHLSHWYVKACGVQSYERTDDDITSAQLALSRLFMRLGIRDGKIAVTTPAPVMTRIIYLTSGLNDEEIELSIRLDADKYIPYPLDEIGFDFWVLGDDGHEISVLLVVGRASMIDECTMIVAKIGLDIDVVDVHEYALARGLSPMMADMVGRTLVVHIDDIKTYVYGVDIKQGQLFVGFDYRQEYLNQTQTMLDDDSLPNKHTAISNNQADDKDDGMGFYEFLATHQAEQSYHTGDDSKTNQLGDDGQDCELNGGLVDYQICFDGGFDEPSYPKTTNFVDDLANDDQDDNQNGDNIKKIADIKKMIDAYKLSEQANAETIILSGLVDDAIVRGLQDDGVSVCLANPFIDMNMGRSVGQNINLPNLVVACGLARALGVDDE